MKTTGFARGLALTLFAILLAVTNVVAQQQPGSLRGRVFDQSGAVIPNTPVTLTLPGGAERTANTGADGSYAFDALPPGSYTIKATAPSFAPFRKTGVAISAGRRATLDITLRVVMDKQKMDVSDDAGVSLDPEASAGTIVLRGEDIQALPDDPDDLADVLQAMAGPSAGPNGAQIIIDGFSGGQLPPKEAIREIRFNSNPFSSEYDRMGFGRVEIFTRPGMDKFHSSLSFSFNNQDLNTRNPFAANKPDHMVRSYSGSFNGPLLKNRSSFFVSFHRRETDDNALIRAQGLDDNLNVININQAVVTPSRSVEIEPRVDLKITEKHTLVVRYGYDSSNGKNQGVSGFNLPSRAYQRSSGEQTVRVTETGMLNTKTVNETRFQFMRPSSDSRGDNTIPTINVQSAFTGGGAQMGHSYSDNNRWELHNITSRSAGKQAIKFGVRLRRVGIDDVSASNFGGTYTFAGGLGPGLDANNRSIPGTSIALTSLDRYRRTLLFQGMGLPADQIRALGGGASQFSLMAGNPEATVSQFDFGGFAQDDWRARPTLTLSGGLRYEAQTNITSHYNFAPRLAFAWSPPFGGSSASPKTVIRGGFGIFYDRVSESLVLQARRYDGQHQQQFIVSERTDPAVLNFFPKVPSLANLATYAVQQTVRRIAGNLESPYTINGSISVERQLPKSFTVATSYIRTRGVHVLRARNINAPLPGTITAANPKGLLPFGNVGNIYEYESSGIMSQNQMIVSVSNRMSRRFTLGSHYSYGHSNSNTDGSGSFPANQYDLTGEYGRASYDVRHSVMLFSSINLPRGIVLSPIVTVRSGNPFNITTGQDTNGDSLYNERPAFATDLSRPSVRVTQWGAFDRIPLPGALIVPRNYGQGPGFFTTSLRASKTFGFGLRESARTARAQAQTQAASGPGGSGPEGRPGGPPPGVMMGGGGPRGGGDHGDHGGRGGMRGGEGGGFGRGSSSDYRYSLTFSVSAQNVLNHTNPSNPQGDLSSPLFGQSLASASSFGGRGPGGGGGGGGAAGNRRVELQLRLSF